MLVWLEEKELEKHLSEAQLTAPPKRFALHLEVQMWHKAAIPKVFSLATDDSNYDENIGMPEKNARTLPTLKRGVESFGK